VDNLNSNPLTRPYSRKDIGWRLFLKTIIARSYPRIVGQQRELSWVLFEILLPMFAVCTYVFVYRALNAPEEYIGFVVMGGAMTAFWLNVLWSMSSQLYWEKQQGNLQLYIIAPNSMMAILLGMAVGGMFATLLRAVTVTIFGTLVFSVKFEIVSYLQLFAVFTLTMIALYGMGMMMASAFLLFGREAWHIANLAQEPIFLASGFFFPIKFLPFWVAAGASLLPLTLGMDAMRQLVFSSETSIGFLDVATEIWILAGLAVLFIVASKYLLAYVEKLAVREGRITESRR